MPSSMKIIVACGTLAAGGAATLAQTWTRLTNLAPEPINMMMLLPDGTVMANANYDSTNTSNHWYRLTPDATGSYLNGTWSTRASSLDRRFYFASQVLRDGRVFVAGGEYGTGLSTSEYYDPRADAWTRVVVPASLLTPPSEGFSDAPSMLLPDGNVLVAPVFVRWPGQTMIFDASSNTWSAGPNLVRGWSQYEATWVKLPDESVLTVDPRTTHSERYIPSLNEWLDDAVLPVHLYDTFVYELGAAMHLHTGKAIYFGATGRTALYKPSGGVAPGSWEAGPVMPDGRGMPDSAAGMLVTGNVLCAFGPAVADFNPYGPPTRFYEYVTASNSFVPVVAPAAISTDIGSYRTILLNLPDGSLLYSYMSRDVWVYRPAGAPLGIKPVIHHAARNPNGSVHLDGLRFNGWSEGAVYGDDAQMSSNYPLVRLRRADGMVAFARTFNWSSTAVHTGERVVSTEYEVPDAVPPGGYTAVVVANGIASDPLCTTPPEIDPGQRAVAACATGSVSINATTSNPSRAGDCRWQRWVEPGGAWVQMGDGANPIGGGGTIDASGTRTPQLTLVAPTGAFPRWGDTGPVRVRCVASNDCGVGVGGAVTIMIDAGDVGTAGGVAGADGLRDTNDLIAFINHFFHADPRADVGTSGGTLGIDGAFDNNDFVAYLNLFFAGC